MKRSHKFTFAMLRRCFVLMLAAVLLVGIVPVLKADAVDTSSVERLNVMLVIDGSGSLPMENDKKGLRYEAIDLFLALLTNEGNNVGAVVFNDGIMLNTDITRISGKAAKMELSKKIRDVGAKGDTNIGLALMTAVDAAVAKSNENDMNSVILFFSDGRTDVPGGQKAMEESLKMKEDATIKAQENRIPVYSICLNASKAADPEELKTISEQTSGSFVAVKKAEDLTPAFEVFYSLIFPDTSNKLTQTVFPESGELYADIAIPTYGAEEVNVILDMTNVKDVEVDAPSGSLSDEQIKDTTMSGGYYDVIKLVNPDSGMWQVDLEGKPGTEVTINVLYNIDSVVRLSTAENTTDYSVGESATMCANLVRGGQVITDPALAQEYVAKLHLKNLSTGAEKTVDMIPDASSTFTYELKGEDYCSWSATVELIYSNLSLPSQEMAVNFRNTAPIANPDYEESKVTVTPISGKSCHVNLADYFPDGQDSSLSYSVVSSQLVQDTIEVDEKSGEVLVNTTKSKLGNVVFQAKDSQGAAAEMTIYFKVVDLRGVIFGGGGLIILAGIIMLCILLYSVLNRPWKGMFTVTTLDGSMDRTHGSFRGKVPLKKLGIRGCGLDGAFVATGRNRMEFRSKKPIFSGAGFQQNPKHINLVNGTNTIYADEEQTMGIEVEVMPQGGFMR